MVAANWTALALRFRHYDYCRRNRTLKGMTPATVHGLATEVWSIRKMLETVAC
jgi:hypothetical protein